MARLLTVVNERKKLRNEYRKHLENTYIQSKKDEEAAVLDLKYAEQRENGIKTPLNHEELREMLNTRQERKDAKF